MTRAVLSSQNPLRKIEEPAGGVVNFCSWTRLETELRESGTVKPNERVRVFVVREDGLFIYLETV